MMKNGNGLVDAEVYFVPFLRTFFESPGATNNGFRLIARFPQIAAATSPTRCFLFLKLTHYARRLFHQTSVQMTRHDERHETHNPHQHYASQVV